MFLNEQVLNQTFEMEGRGLEISNGAQPGGSP